MTRTRSHDTPQQPQVRGACPGVAAPMTSGDGLLLRVRHPVGGLTLEQAEALAAAAERHGNGRLELTSRGNLQLRGVTRTTLTDAQTALIRAGVADADPEREAVRNVLAAPVTDLDPTAVADGAPVARAVADAVADHPRLRGLPPKTGIVVDGGGTLGVPDVYADVRLDAVPVAQGVAWRVGLAGRAADARPVGTIGPQDTAAAVVALLEALVDLAGEGQPPRMATALLERGEAPFRRALAPWSGDVVAPEPGDRQAPRAADGWLQAEFPFGALEAWQLRGLAVLARERRLAPETPPTLRLTPWRSVLITGMEPAAVTALGELGAITDAADPRRGLGACVGAPGCASATTATRDDALALEAVAPTLLAAGERVHVSGCGKGCGAPAHAGVTLVADAGYYAMTLTGGVAHAPDWPPAPPATVRRRVAALDTLFARERHAPRESLDAFISRLGRESVVRRVEEETTRV
ncbi:precorrin-3B synthase [Aquisalimonas sp. 2447]|uniref:precorrin-3B synthase n=1 Tax=Aquisalimonas sp. 2447 TaxID=2740807 RepID=UPI0014323680|nr:precorrin-3B synthase [Aquisalimonas sp. 2447]QIT57001.1 precorrin-3B synthase [Aquisalimonas sp. 2447]